MAENKNNEGDEKDFFKKENKKSKIQIGKNGITQSLIEEIRRQLKTHEFVEVKLLKSFRQGMVKNGMISKIEELASKTDSKILSLKGFTLVITAKNKKTRNNKSFTEHNNNIYKHKKI